MTDQQTITAKARDMALQQGGVIGDMLRQLATLLDQCQTSLASERRTIEEYSAAVARAAKDRDHWRARSGALADERDEAVRQRDHWEECNAKGDELIEQFREAIRKGAPDLPQKWSVMADLESVLENRAALQREFYQLQHEYGTMAASVEKAYAVMGAPEHDVDPDARDPFYIGDAVERRLYLCSIQIRSLESSLAAAREMGRQAQRESDALRRVAP